MESNNQWGHESQRYEYDGKSELENGLAPRDSFLEDILFNTDRPCKGINFDKYETIEVTVDSKEPLTALRTFEEAKLHPAMMETVRLFGYTQPTPIQAYSIPCLLAGEDLLAGAQTGSGKTAAYLIPVLNKLMGKAKKIQQPRSPNITRLEPLVLILVPTRELATQVFDECRRFCYRSMLRPCVVYGGVSIQSQQEELRKGCDVLVATPGRLQDLARRGSIQFARVRHVVLDEADRMLSMCGEALRELLSASDLPNDGSLQVCMYSATFPEDVQELAREHLADRFVTLQVGRLGATTQNITQRIEWIEEDDKLARLEAILLDQPPTRTMVFVNTKRQCDTVDDYLYNKTFPVTSIHGGRTQREREDSLIAFRNGVMPILIATDVAARGIDIKGVMHVINFDCPGTIEEYVHRIGRTARIGNQGLATTFFNGNFDIAVDLTRTLLENAQEVPEFLEQYQVDALDHAAPADA